MKLNELLKQRLRSQHILMFMKLFPFKDEAFSAASFVFVHVCAMCNRMRSKTKEIHNAMANQISFFKDSISFYCKYIHGCDELKFRIRSQHTCLQQSKRFLFVNWKFSLFNKDRVCPKHKDAGSGSKKKVFSNKEEMFQNLKDEMPIFSIHNLVFFSFLIRFLYSCCCCW